MTFSFLYLSFSTLYSSFLWRTDTIVFAKLNKPPLNVFEINKPGGRLNRGFMVYTKEEYDRRQEKI